MMDKKNILTKTLSSDNDRVIKTVVDFLLNERYKYGEILIKRHDGKVQMSVTEKIR